MGYIPCGPPTPMPGLCVGACSQEIRVFSPAQAWQRRIKAGPQGFRHCGLAVLHGAVSQLVASGYFLLCHHVPLRAGSSSQCSYTYTLLSRGQERAGRRERADGSGSTGKLPWAAIAPKPQVERLLRPSPLSAPNAALPSHSTQST